MVLSPIETEYKKILTKSVGPVDFDSKAYSFTRDDNALPSSSLADFYSMQSLFGAALAGVPLKDLRAALSNAPDDTSPRPTEPYGADGVYIPHCGSPPVFRTCTGRLIHFGDGLPPTSVAPLNLTAKMVLGLFTNFTDSWANYYITSLCALDAAKRRGGGQLIKNNPYEIWTDDEVSCPGNAFTSGAASDALVHIVEDALRNRGRELVRSVRPDTLRKLITFGLAYGGEAIGVRVWHITSIVSRDVLGYIPTESFSAFLISGAPLLSEKSIKAYVSKCRER